MTPKDAARALRPHTDPATCRRLPRVALEEAIRAVMRGACPAGVGDSLREAAR